MKSEINMKELGMDLAHGDDNDQSELINSLGSELFIACSGDSGLETQCCYISSKLNHSGRRFIQKLSDFIELREKEEKDNA